MPTIVRSGGGGTDISAANATTNQVLSGATFYSNASDDIQTGTMNNKGAVSQAAPYSGSAGYYSSISITTTGTATNAHVLSGKTFMNADGAQNGAMANKGAVDTSVGVGGTYTNTGGYYSSIKIVGPTLSGNATADKVLKGYTFYKDSGEQLTGTIESKTITSSVGVGGTYTNTTAGYYTSIKVTGPTFSESTGSASQVLSGVKFYSNAGKVVTGTMTNRGSVSCTLSHGGTYTGSAGYYSGISITAPSLSLTGNATKWDVRYPETFYNATTTKLTGALNIYYKSGDSLISYNWQTVYLDWYPDYYGAGVDEGDSNDRVKIYRGDYNSLHWCYNGSGDHKGYVLAMQSID